MARASRRRSELNLWAHGRVDLGLADEEIGRLTLAQLGALDERYQAAQDRQDWHTALIVCTLANLHRAKDQKALEPGDVMPWLRRKPKPETVRQSPQQMRAIIEEITREMGGIVHPKNVPLDVK